MSVTLRDTISIAMTGCVHDFQISEFMGCDRFDVLTCKACGAEATAGEVAWMLAGGQIVRISYETEAEQQQQLEVLINMPVEGGVQ